MLQSFVLATALSTVIASSVYADSPSADANTTPRLYITSDHNANIAYNDNGDVWYWGGMMEITNNVPAFLDNKPVRMGTMKNIAQVKVNSDNIFVKKDGTVWSWPAGLHPTSDSGSSFKVWEPLQVPDLQDVVQIAQGLEFSAAMKKDGTVWAWGGNRAGELGDGTFNPSEKPVQVKLP